MTIQRKFIVLLGVLAATVVANLAVALWAINVLERRQSRPFQSMTSVLKELETIKRAIEAQMVAMTAAGMPNAAWIGRGVETVDAGAAPRPVYDREQAAIAASFDGLLGNESFRSASGITSSRSLRERLEKKHAAAMRWWETAAPDAGQETASEMWRTHELIEKMELRIVDGSKLAIDNVAYVRGRVVQALLASVVIVVLAIIDGLLIVRRWVVRPVASLREAAVRIGAGDFTHRVPVAGRDELAQLSGEINNMAGLVSAMQEERVERERLAAVGEMVRRIVHNLRNPLAGIRSLAELTRSTLGAGTAERETQDRIIKTVDRFEAWLSGLLRATGQLQLAVQPVEVRPWLAGIVEAHRAMAEGHGVAFTCETDEGQPAPLTAEFDPVHLEHAVTAVVTNAIQATPRGGRVRIKAETGQDREVWTIRVSDTGPGVPPDLVDTIFLPYFTTKKDGSGIGLAFAKSVVEQHKGRITVEAGILAPLERHAGRGSVFVITLKLANPTGLANTGHVSGQ